MVGHRIERTKKRMESLTIMLHELRDKQKKSSIRNYKENQNLLEANNRRWTVMTLENDNIVPRREGG